MILDLEDEVVVDRLGGEAGGEDASGGVARAARGEELVALAIKRADDDLGGASRVEDLGAEDGAVVEPGGGGAEAVPLRLVEGGPFAGERLDAQLGAAEVVLEADPQGSGEHGGGADAGGVDRGEAHEGEVGDGGSVAVSEEGEEPA